MSTMATMMTTTAATPSGITTNPTTSTLRLPNYAPSQQAMTTTTTSEKAVDDANTITNANNNKKGDGTGGTAVAFGGLLVEIFDLFLTCMGSDDLRDDAAALGFIGVDHQQQRELQEQELRQLQSKQPKYKQQKHKKQRKAIDPDMDPPGKLQDLDPPGRKSDEDLMDENERTKTKNAVKLKKWIAKRKKEKMNKKKNNNSKIPQVEKKEIEYNIFDESNSNRRERRAVVATLDYTFSNSTYDTRDTRDTRDTSLDGSTTTYHTEGTTTTTTTVATAVTVDNEVDRRQDDTGRRFENDDTVAGTLFVQRDDNSIRIDDGKDQRDEPAAEEVHEKMLAAESVVPESMTLSEQFHSLNPLKPSTIAKYNKQWPPLQFPTGRYESFNTEVTRRSEQTAQHLDSTIPKSPIIQANRQKLVHNWVWRSKYHQARQAQQHRQGILARAVAARSKAASAEHSQE